MRNRKMQIIVFLLLLPMKALAEHDPREPPEVRPERTKCDAGGMKACIDQNGAALAAAQASADALNPGLALLRNKMSDLERNRSIGEQSLASIQAEISSLSLETADSAGSLHNNFSAPMPGFPTLEYFFHLHPLQKKWQEKYAGERLQKLTARLQAAEHEKSSADAQNQKNLGEIQSLNSDIQSMDGQKQNHLSVATQHYKMCQRGCREQFCP